MTRPALMTFCFFLLILNGFLQAFVGIGHFALLSNFAVYTGFGYLFLSLLSFATAYAVWTFQNWASRSLIAVALIMIGLSMASLIEIAGFSVLSFFVPTVGNLVIAGCVISVLEALLFLYVAQTQNLSYGARSTSGYQAAAATPLTVKNREPSATRYLISTIGPDGAILRHEVNVARPICVVGRSPDPKEVDLRLTDAGISRTHAKFELVGDALMVSDLQSLNHTFIDGDKVGASPTRVDAHNSVVLGDVKVAISRA